MDGMPPTEVASIGSIGLEVDAEFSEPKRRSMGFIHPEGFFQIVTPLVVVIVWEALSRFSIVDPRILAPPTAVVNQFWQLLREGQMMSDIWHTVGRFVVGTLVGLVPGLLIGLTFGLFRWTRAILRPLVMILYPVPRIALFPLILIFIGLNETSNYMMIAIGPFLTVIIITMGAVLDIDPVYREVAVSFNTGLRDLYSLVTIPAALPAILGGVRIAVGEGLLATIAVEFLVTSDGIGALIWRSWQVLSLKDSLVGLVLAATLGVVTFYIIDIAERRLIPWQDHG